MDVSGNDICWSEKLPVTMYTEGTGKTRFERIHGMMNNRSDYTDNWNSLKDPKRLVRDGYDAVAADYLTERLAPGPDERADVRLLEEFIQELPAGALVLDAGCGAGVPITRVLAQRCRVVGIDFSRKQLTLARRFVPEATFICQDMTALAFSGNAFDAICSYYAIIHVPREEHALLLRRFCHILKPDGLALLCFGSTDSPADIESDYFGHPMYWSHFDSEQNLSLLEASGLDLLWSRMVVDALWPTSSHLFVLARKPAPVESRRLG